MGEKRHLIHQIEQEEIRRSAIKGSTLNMRITSEVKAEIISRSGQMGLTVPDYIEHLVYNDNAKTLENLNLQKRIEDFKEERQQLLQDCEELQQSNVLEQNQYLNELFDLLKDEEITYYSKDGEELVSRAETKTELFNILVQDYLFKIRKELE